MTESKAKKMLTFFWRFISFVLAVSFSCISTLPSALLCFKDNFIELSTDKTRQETFFVLSFRAHCGLSSNELITVTFPRFSRSGVNGSVASNLDLGDVIIIPSLLFKAGWLEGSYEATNKAPYNDSKLLLLVEHYMTIAADDIVTVNISIENKLKSYCGFAAWDSVISLEPHFAFTISSNMTTGTAIVRHPQVGRGCAEWDNCNGNGLCDFCHERCVCNPGHGSPQEMSMVGRVFDGKCKQKTCPFGKQIAGVAQYNKTQSPHDQVECSGAGNCDRLSGQCQCFGLYAGAACERMRCPNDCSGHGQCLSLRQMAALSRAQPLQSSDHEYGSPSALASINAWDADVIFGCVCDSSWDVGFRSGQRQLTEWFGGDCSRRRCPTGDNPMTQLNESDCQGRRQQAGPGHPFLSWLPPLPASQGRGDPGNVCQVDCSGRGNCDYSTGLCTCHSPSWGDNCAKLAFPYRNTDGSL